MGTAMRAFNVLLVVVVALTVGCNRRAANAVAQQIGSDIEDHISEAGRQERAQMFGPTILASLVGAAAPPSGPLCLLATDAGWQQGIDASAAPREGPAVGLRMFFKAPPRDLSP